MSSFRDDIAIIFAGPLSEVATYTPTRGLPISLSVIRRRPDDEVSFNSTTLSVATAHFVISVADVAEPMPGDIITIEDDMYIVQGEPARDARHLWWSMETRPFE